MSVRNSLNKSAPESSDAESGPISFTTHSSLLDGLRLSPDYIIDGFLEVGEQLLLYGQPKIGKTFLAIQLAVEVAKGGTFLSWPIPKKRKVLYINFEMGLRIFSSRVTKHLVPPSSGLTTEQKSAFYDNQLGGNLVFTTHPRSIDVLKGSKVLRDLVTLHRPELIVIDTLAKTHGVDERANEKIGAVLTAIRNACVVDDKAVSHVIVHHARKAAIGMEDSNSYVSASEIRGGSAIRGEADVIAGLYARPGGRGGGITRSLILEARNANLKDLDIEFTRNLRFEVAQAQTRDSALDLLKKKLQISTGPVPKNELAAEIARQLNSKHSAVPKYINPWVKWAVANEILREVPAPRQKGKRGADVICLEVLDPNRICESPEIGPDTD